MKRDKGALLRISTCLILAAIFTGCAHQKAYKKADKYVQQQNYDQAVRSFQEAIDLADKPKTIKKYQARLSEVRLQAAHYYYLQAEDDFAVADLGSALQCIGHAIRYQPAVSRSRDLQKRIQSAIQAAEQHHTEAMALADGGQWREAVTALQGVARDYTTMPGLTADREHVKQRAYNDYLGKAKRLLGEDDLDGAAEKANLALTFMSHGLGAKDLIRTVEDHREAERLIALGRRQLAARSPQEALDLLTKASYLHASAKDLVELMSQAKQGVCDLWMAQAEVHLQQERRVAALPLLLRCRDLLPGYGDVDQKIASARAGLSEQHLAQAALYQKLGLQGAALCHAVAALEYSDQGPDAREQLRVSMQAVQKAIQYSVVFGGFSALQEQAFAVDRLNPMALVLLNRLRPACVRILEQPQADVDAVLEGEILTLDLLEDTQVKAHGTSEYQDGMRPVPNPDYLAAKEEADLTLSDLNSARERLAMAKKRRALAGNPDPNDVQAVRRMRKAQADVVEAQERTVTAATNLAIASTKAAATPQEILVPNIVAYEYPIHTVKKSAQLVCLIKMTDTQTGAMLLADQIKAQWSQSDTVIQAVPERNVPGDPLELDDDMAFYDQAIEALEQRLGDMLQLGLSKHSERFVKGFQQAESSGDQSLAVDQGLKYLFAHPVGHEHTHAMTEYLHTYLGNEDVLLDIAGLLKKHCRILLRYAEFPAQLDERENAVVIRKFTAPGHTPVRCPCTLVSIDDHPVHSIADVRNFIGRQGVGDKVTLSVQSEGRLITTELALPRQ
ncbi:MAG: hypothetical protein HQ515_17175 [Phycisphaeraceae bacterium]|nr:hypothetical protein [Phycisphaeraceae bacterium]